MTLKALICGNWVHTTQNSNLGEQAQNQICKFGKQIYPGPSGHNPEKSMNILSACGVCIFPLLQENMSPGHFSEVFQNCIFLKYGLSNILTRQCEVPV